MPTTHISIREWQAQRQMMLDRGELKGIDLFYRPFIVCPTCGNKRCPHATDRAFACTGSNEPGQKGSYYE